jgi:hypothetical protein
MWGSAAVPNIMQNTMPRKLSRAVSRAFSSAAANGSACGRGGVALWPRLRRADQYSVACPGSVGVLSSACLIEVYT